MAAQVTPQPHAQREVLLVTDKTTRGEIEEAMLNVRATMKRAPDAFQERYSAKLDALLDDWERAPE
jgi:hypothetical protein